MMVETILESSQDFGMSNGVLPQWKRELLQRRAARSRPPVPPATPAPPPPPPPADDDEELRYGPGIVKRLKSRYLSLALREAPRRRPSVLRRAASLEHLLDERPPPAPRPHARPARPVSLAAPSHVLASRPSQRRDSVKRARSVDALSRLDGRDESPSQIHVQLPTAPILQVEPQVSYPQPPPPPPSPPPPLPRTTRPPRRPVPLLRETERPPPDVVRSTLRKFESAPTRRPAPAARVSAVLRGLEALPRSSTPEPRGRSPSPAAADISAIDETEGAALSNETKQVTRAALEGIARAGSSVRYSFEAPKRGSHLPPLAATNPVLLSRSRLSSPRRIGVIRPMPASEKSPTSPTSDFVEEKSENITSVSTPTSFDIEPPPTPRQERKEPPPSAIVEPIPRHPPEERSPTPIRNEIETINTENVPEPEKPDAPPVENEMTKPLINGYIVPDKVIENTETDKLSRIGGAGIERAWTGTKEKCIATKEKRDAEVKCAVPCWSRSVNGNDSGSPGVGRKLRAPAPASTSVVFNFSNRKEVPDYIENDGVLRRPSRRNCFKAGESGVVLLRPDACSISDDDGDEDGLDGEGDDARAPSPCSVRFVNDNVLINGKSSMVVGANRMGKDRAAKLKLQFDDSLTRTFEYPSEISLCEELALADTQTVVDAPATAPTPAPTPAPEPADAPATALAANTHIVSAALSQYTPSKTLPDAFPLGLARRPDETGRTEMNNTETSGAEIGAEAETEAGDARPCAAESARTWSEARTHHTDLLF